MEDKGLFLTGILEKIGRRYELKGKLSGTMKLGQALSSEEMATLGNFFGLAPLRVNAKEEVRLLFDKLLEDGQEQWLEKISGHFGYSLKEKNNPDAGQQIKTLLSRLTLAFPKLKPLLSFFERDCTFLERMFARHPEETVNTRCFQAAEIVVFLLNPCEPITISELGARFCSDSKALRGGELQRLVVQWLRLCSPDSSMLENDDDLWACHNVLTDRLTVNGVLYGPVIYEKNGKTFDWIYQLYLQGEAATIGWSNICDIERMYWKEQENEPPILICCENEAPFSQLMRQEHNQALLFTGGFPGSAVQKLYQMLAPHSATCYHWGDSDQAGLRIAAIMHSLYPLQLFRCDITTLRRHKHYLLPLSQKQKDAALHSLVSQPVFPFAEELLFTLENGWLEQEGWQGIGDLLYPLHS